MFIFSITKWQSVLTKVTNHKSPQFSTMYVAFYKCEFALLLSVDTQIPILKWRTETRSHLFWLYYAVCQLLFVWYTHRKSQNSLWSLSDKTRSEKNHGNRALPEKLHTRRKQILGLWSRRTILTDSKEDAIMGKNLLLV